MIGASFCNIGSKGMKLTDLVPTGYEEYASTIFKSTTTKAGGLKGTFTIKILNKNGGVEVDKAGHDMEYSYYRTIPKKSSVWDNDGRWVQSGVGDITKDNDVTFQIGQGLWFSVSASAYPAGYDPHYFLTNNGDALISPCSIELCNGAKGIAIPLSKSVKLTQIIPTGYEEYASTIFKSTTTKAGGLKGTFTIKILNKNGGVEVDKAGHDMEYSYYRTIPKKSSAWDNDGRWVQSGVGDITAANDVTFNTGDGLWVSVSAAAYPTGYDPKYYLEFPGIDDEYSEKDAE